MQKKILGDFHPLKMRYFCNYLYISKNWRGKPLLTRETVVNLISSTRTNTGLEVKAVLDENEYETGREICDDEFSALSVHGDEFHPEWNYTIKPYISLKV